MNESPADAFFKPIPKEVLSHQLALGRLCWVWATLDRSVNEVLAVLLNIDAAGAACIGTELDNIAGRMRLLKKLVHTRNMPTWWLAMTLKVFNRIEVELAPLRNRCVHDSWAFSGDNLVRTDRRAFLKKLEAHSDNKLMFDIKHTMSEAEMDDLRLDSFIAIMALKGVCRDIENQSEISEHDQAKSLLSVVFHTWEDQLEERRQQVGKNPPPSEA